MEPPMLEKNIGLRFYGTKTLGTGGHVRTIYEDFTVEEVLTSGEVAGIAPIEVETVGGTGDFLLCILVKSGCDTFLALKKISRMLRVSPKRISAGGLKDANALTAQHVTIRHVEPSRIAQINGNDIRLLPLRFVEAPITAKSILGNTFRIKIRNIEPSHEALSDIIQIFISEINTLGGVPNFYGHQRFGTFRPITHKVGKYIVKRDFENAVVTYLTELSYLESSESRNAKNNFLEERDPRKSLSLYPRNLTYERLMLEHLAKNKNDYIGALRKLPLRLRRLLVNAYQSFLFNEFLSERHLKQLRLNSIYEGDYVVGLDSAGLPTGNTRVVEAEDVTALSEELVNGRVALALPVVGFTTKLSRGMQGEIEVEVLRRENITPRDFYVGPLHEISSSGKCRPALVRMRDFEIEIMQNNQGDEKLNLGLRFFLPRDSYATTILRELMKPVDIIQAGF
jgi:tRNA pseudouridine13 synthase